MKKLLIILMLLALPFQSSWAMAAVYCQHEQGTKVQHFGHHSHQHQGSDAHQPDYKGQLSQVHQDCGYCHASTPAFFAAALPSATLPTGSIPITFYAISFSSHIPDVPQRPDRRPVG